MWTQLCERDGSRAQTRVAAQDVERVRVVQETLWYVLAIIALAEMVFGAWAVGLLFR
jgi:hypothetical protein